MLIKLHTPFTAFVKQREVKAAKPLTYKEKINADRVAMVILLLMTVVGAIVAS